MKIKKRLTVWMIVLGAAALAACGSKTEEPVEPSEPVELVVDEEEEKQDAGAAAEEEESVAEEETAEEGEEESTAENEPAADTPKDEKSADESSINWDEITKLDEPVIMYVQSRLNIRKGPDTAFDAIGRLAVNDEVQVIGTVNGSPWKEIKYNDYIAFVHGDYLSADPVDMEVQKTEEVQQEAPESEPQTAAPEPQPEPVPQPDPVPQPAPQAEAPAAEVSEPAGILFIGDSRTCQMQVATQGAGCSWICEYGTKYEWFETVAVPKADKLVGQGTKVVICMGVNDPGSCRSYASLANSKAAGWRDRGAAVYFVSLNPTAEPFDDKNPAIDNFNASMPGLLSGVNWIDTVSTVKQGGYTLVDGIHFDAVSNVNIFNLIRGKI